MKWSSGWGSYASVMARHVRPAVDAAATRLCVRSAVTMSMPPARPPSRRPPTGARPRRSAAGVRPPVRRAGAEPADRIRVAWQRRAESDYLFELLDRVRLDDPHVRLLRLLRHVPARAPLARSQPAPHRAARRRDHVRVAAGRGARARATSCSRTSIASRPSSACCARRPREFRDPIVWTLLSLVAAAIVHIIMFILLDGDLVTHDRAEGAIEHELSVDLHAARRAGCRRPIRRG